MQCRVGIILVALGLGMALAACTVSADGLQGLGVCVGRGCPEDAPKPSGSSSNSPESEASPVSRSE